MLSSNWALSYVSYPMQALVKSCKILPVMITGLIRRTYNYPFIKYFCAFMVTVGLVVFNFGGKSDDFTVGYLGGALLITSLLFDGLVNT